MSALPANFTLLQVIPDLETGGAEQTTLDVAEAVVHAGGRAIVASHGGRMVADLGARGASWAPMPVQSKNPLVMAANRGRLIDLIRREDVSLVHVRSRAPAFAAFSAARAAGVPCLATYHGLYSSGNPLKRWYNSVMVRGPVTIANSAFTRDYVIAEHRIDPARVIAIPRGVDLGRFDPAKVAPARVAALLNQWAIPAEDHRVRFVLAGRLSRWKGQGLLIDAAHKLKAAQGDGFLVILAGDDQGRSGYRHELEAAIAGANLSAAVRLVGHCGDMPAAYLASNVACAPSLDPEPFGRTAVEPQAMGRPIIAADHGAPRETVVAGETGWLFKPGDAEALAGVMADAIAAGPERRAAMGAAGLARARRLYSAAAMCEATLDVYARLLGSRL
ncbi:MAG TPA: glycosyltransferase family 4 protein [Caulobacteraceae bacterium]|jgi:glycosyltransferase involved in cell wall biosynthesis|nr:glycosyltransferase family 4 protein [Caulobacteraceae bacterium]